MIEIAFLCTFFTIVISFLSSGEQNYTKFSRFGHGQFLIQWENYASHHSCYKHLSWWLPALYWLLLPAAAYWDIDFWEKIKSCRVHSCFHTIGCLRSKSRRRKECELTTESRLTWLQIFGGKTTTLELHTVFWLNQNIGIVLPYGVFLVALLHYHLQEKNK